MLLSKYVKTDYYIYHAIYALQWQELSIVNVRNWPLLQYNTNHGTYQSSQVFKDWWGDLEISRLTSEQKSEITGTRHGVTDRERDDATIRTSRITMTKNKIKY